VYNQNDIVEIKADNFSYDPKRAAHLGRVINPPFAVSDGFDYDVRTLDMNVYLLHDQNIVSLVADASLIALFEAAEAARLAVADSFKVDRPKTVVEGNLEAIRAALAKTLPVSDPVLAQLDAVESTVKSLLDEQQAAAGKATL
jgi:hypothetical protein